MGTRKGFPGWVPYEDSAPPLLSRSRFQEGKVIGHAEGPRPGEPQRRLRCGGSFHQKWDPFRKGTPLI
jgi:hypothetical protein